MVADIPRALPTDVAEVVRDSLLGRLWESVDYLYVVDAAGSLVGVVSIPRLLNAPAPTPLSELMAPAVAVTPETDQEEAAVLALQREIKAIPVVDAEHRFLGVVPPRCLLQIMHREHTEDLLRMAGIARHEHVRDSFTWSMAWGMARGRLGWLIVGLMGGVAASGLVGFFEATLRTQIALAFFIPVIVYMADAVGTQTETILVRTLALGPTSLRQELAREARVGATLGIVLGSATLLLILGIWGDLRLAVTVGLALGSTSTLATFVATLVPWILYRMGRDPALGSGPFATIVQDIISLFLYFLIASALLRWG